MILGVETLFLESAAIMARKITGKMVGITSIIIPR